MSLNFSTHPGPRERHLQRKHQNPLFGEEGQSITQEQLILARQDDETELNHFLRYFRDLVQEAVDLKPETESEVVLDIKERLDKCFAHCCALPGEQSEIKAAVSKLIEVIMKAVRQGAANDPVALTRLDEEDIARRMHFELQEYPFIADLLLPDCPVAEDELVPSLLSEPEETIAAALQIFEHEQLEQIYQDGQVLLTRLHLEPASTSIVANKLKLILSACEVPPSS
ncbi:MAG: hypothetical protein OQK73_08270 [Gammaproteobacteria bacterium]|nr:hypothetical protein [Gammaproteobacteria bacterium]